MMQNLQTRLKNKFNKFTFDARKYPVKVNLSPWQILSKYFPSHLQRGVIVTTVHGILEFHQVRFHPLLSPLSPCC